MTAEAWPEPNRSITTTLLMVSVVAVMSAPRGVAFMGLLVLPFWLLWVVKTVVQMVLRPQQRRIKGLQLLIWVVALGVLGLRHQWLANDARARMDEVVAQLNAYHATHQQYPITIDELNLAPHLQADFTQRQAFYALQTPLAPTLPPSLFYRSTFDSFDKYFYRFETQEWAFLPD